MAFTSSSRFELATRSKDNDAVIGNHAVLRYVSVTIYTDHPDAVRQIRTMLARDMSA